MKERERQRERQRERKGEDHMTERKPDQVKPDVQVEAGSQSKWKPAINEGVCENVEVCEDAEVCEGVVRKPDVQVEAR